MGEQKFAMKPVAEGSGGGGIKMPRPDADT